MYRYLLFILCAAIICSCNVFESSVMFKTGKDYPYASLDSLKTQEYKIAPEDVLEFALFTNDGFKLVDVLSSAVPGLAVSSSTQFVLDKEGYVKLPTLERTKISGLTSKEAEKFLEEKYTPFYRNPFVLVQVVNRRVYVFPGSGSSGQVIALKNENTTLVEALAVAGGITNSGKSKRIKLIRGSRTNPEVFLVDLSTIEGMKKGNVVLQANDIIYVEPVRRISQSILTEVTPIAALLSTIITFTLFLR